MVPVECKTTGGKVSAVKPVADSVLKPSDEPTVTRGVTVVEKKAATDGSEAVKEKIVATEKAQAGMTEAVAATVPVETPGPEAEMSIEKEQTADKNCASGMLVISSWVLTCSFA